jgi:hypothetical protein
VLKKIERFLSDDEEDWSERSERGWASEARQSMLAAVQKFVGDEKWRGIVLTSLQSDDEHTFATAAEAAKKLGIDTWDEYYTRTEDGQDYWCYLMQTEDRSRIEKVVELAEARIPLSEIATGPGDELGLGPEFKHHGALDFVLQDLGKFPGLGWTLIEAGLRSPVVRNRNMGIRALAGWDREKWPEGAKEYVESCLDAEPNDEVRKGLVKLLAGEPLGF